MADLGLTGSVGGGGLTGLPAGPRLNYSDPDVAMEIIAAGYLKKDLGLGIGPRFLGLTFDLMLLGVATHQFLIYVNSPGKDRMFVRAVVYWTYTVAVATSIFSMWLTWFLFIEHWGTYIHFFKLDKMMWYNILSVLITAPVQVFYMERAYKLLREKKWVYYVTTPFIVGTVVSCVGLSWVMKSIKEIHELSRAPPWFYTWDATMLITDTLLTGLILYGLARAKTGWSETDRVVSRLIRTSVEAQLPATLYAFGFLLTYSINPQSQVIYFWTMQHTKVYVVSLLAVLNFRTTMRLTNSQGTSGSKPPANVYRNRRYTTADSPLEDGITLEDASGMSHSHLTPVLRLGPPRRREDNDLEVHPDLVSPEEITFKITEESHDGVYGRKDSKSDYVLA